MPQMLFYRTFGTYTYTRNFFAWIRHLSVFFFSYFLLFVNMGLQHLSVRSFSVLVTIQSLLLVLKVNMVAIRFRIDFSSCGSLSRNLTGFHRSKMRRKKSYSNIFKLKNSEINFIFFCGSERNMKDGLERRCSCYSRKSNIIQFEWNLSSCCYCCSTALNRITENIFES